MSAGSALPNPPDRAPPLKNLLIACCCLAVSLQGLAEPPWTREGDVSTVQGSIHYRVAGEGPPLLMLHGYFGQGGQWQRYLEDVADDYTVIAPDLPGHGRSTHPGDGFDTAGAAAAMWGLVDSLGYEEIAAIGYSAGGMALLSMAVQQPNRISALILCASAHKAAISPGPGEWEDLPPAFQADMLRNHPGGIPQVRRLLQGHGIAGVSRDALTGIVTPVLLVVGDRDDAFPLPTVLETYEALPDARLWVFPQTGHTLFWTEWGGSAELDRQFPTAAKSFLQASH